MWARVTLVGVVAGFIASLGAPSLPDAVAVGLASGGLPFLGAGFLHPALKRCTVSVAAIRSEVSRSPSLSSVVPLPGVSGIICALIKGVPGPGMALVLAGAAVFTWVAWEATMWVASKSEASYRLLTHGDVQAGRARLSILKAAENRWRDRDW
jgi:hypothetical protein